VSAQFIIRYRGVAVRFCEPGARRMYEFTSDSEATQFFSEADAYLCAKQNNMLMEWVEVCPLSKVQSPKSKEVVA